MNFTDLDQALEPAGSQPHKRTGGNHSPPIVADTNAYLNRSDGAGGVDGNSFEFEYMPTPLNPVKLERNRLENLMLTFTIFVGVLFSIIALLAPIVTYKDAELRMEVYGTRIRGCIFPRNSQSSVMSGSSSQCEDVNLDDVFCGGFHDSSRGFVANAVLACLCGAVAFFFAIFLTCGCAVMCKHLVPVLALLQLVFLFIATITSSAMLTNRRCESTSLKKIGFRYGPAFPLVLTAFILQALALVFYMVRRCVKPVRYQTGSGFGRRACCPCC